VILWWFFSENWLVGIYFFCLPEESGPLDSRDVASIRAPWALRSAFSVQRSTFSVFLYFLFIFMYSPPNPLRGGFHPQTPWERATPNPLAGGYPQTPSLLRKEGASLYFLFLGFISLLIGRYSISPTGNADCYLIPLFYNTWTPTGYRSRVNFDFEYPETKLASLELSYCP